MLSSSSWYPVIGCGNRSEVLQKSIRLCVRKHFLIERVQTLEQVSQTDGSCTKPVSV